MMWKPAAELVKTVLATLRKLASKLDKPYQTYIHELLEKAAKRVVEKV